MADNYLEKRYAELNGGPKIVRRTGKSLDCLLKAVGCGTTSQVHSEELNMDKPHETYIVKQAQLDAMIASARHLGLPFEARADEGATASIEVKGRSSFELGQILLAMSLKAAELYLRTDLEGSAQEVGGATASLLRVHK